MTPQEFAAEALRFSEPILTRRQKRNRLKALARRNRRGLRGPLRTFK